jgi:hypothetical protein
LISYSFDDNLTLHLRSLPAYAAGHVALAVGKVAGGRGRIGEKNEEGADGQVEHQGHCGGAQPPLPASLPDRCLGTESQRLAAVEAVSKEGRGSGTTMDPFFICPYNFGTSVLPALLCKYTGLYYS